MISLTFAQLLTLVNNLFAIFFYIFCFAYRFTRAPRTYQGHQQRTTQHTGSTGSNIDGNIANR